MGTYQELSGRAAVVTGASRGIGEAAAHALAAEGVAVVLAARSEAPIEAIAERIRADGGKAEAVRCDVSRFEDVEAAIERCRSAFGRLDILLNNAGIIEPIAPLAESDPAAWGTVIDINVKGVYNGMRVAAPIMAAAGGGVIINISSGAAVNAMDGWSHYCASKAAVLMLTRCGHKELAGEGVRVVGLSPGTVATEMQRVIKVSGINPVSQLEWEDHIPPEWVGRAVAWLATGDAGEFDGTDVSLRVEDIRRRIGLID